MLAPGSGEEAAGRGLPWGQVPPWEELRARVRRIPGLGRPSPAGCPVCRGPVGPRYALCYQCDQHEMLAHGLLADAVVPISYAIRDSAFARDLWQYKSWQDTDRAMRVRLLALLLVFLHEHGECVWRAADMPSPDRLAVVPTGRGRPGPHPLRAMVAPLLRLPLISLTLRPGEQGRDLNTGRFAVGVPVTGANVLLLDDTWVSGSSVQSAAAALKLAGAARVAVVLLGRHINPGERCAAAITATREDYDPAKCAICGNR